VVTSPFKFEAKRLVIVPSTTTPLQLDQKLSPGTTIANIFHIEGLLTLAAISDTKLLEKDNLHEV
jgi:hypothetical protein